MLVRVYTCQNATLLEITCGGSDKNLEKVVISKAGTIDFKLKKVLLLPPPPPPREFCRNILS